MAVTPVSHVALDKPEPVDRPPGRETAFSRGADLELYGVWQSLRKRWQIPYSTEPKYGGGGLPTEARG